MKVLILWSHSYYDRLQRLTPEKLSSMLDSLSQCGIQAEHYIVGSSSELISDFHKIEPDLVFSTCYYTAESTPNRQNVHALLEGLGIPYIGSDSHTLEMVLRKSALKERWLKDRVTTPEYLTVSKETPDFHLDPIFRTLINYPYIIKPDLEGNSRGISEDSIVYDFSQLEKQVRRIQKNFGDVLVEQYLGSNSKIREFTVAMIGNRENMLLMPSEIVLKQPHKVRIITTRDKDEHNTLALPVPHDRLYKKIVAFAEKAFQSACVRDYARCDLILKDDILFAIEINGQPMIPDKWFEICSKDAGLTSTQYINAILLFGMARNIHIGKIHTHVPGCLLKTLPDGIAHRLTHFSNPINF